MAGNDVYFIKGDESTRDNLIEKLKAEKIEYEVVKLFDKESVYTKYNYPTIYVMFRLKDGGHLEKLFHTKEELSEFSHKWKDHILPHDTEVIDTKKGRKANSQELLFWILFVGFLLYVVIDMFI